MNKQTMKHRAFCFLGLALAAFWAMAVISPSSLPAQDIDDVMQGLDADFNLGSNKEELKRSNIETANEQNREDVKIQESTQGSTVTGDLTVTYTAVIDPSNFDWLNIIVNGTPVAVNQMVIATGSVSTTVPNVTVPSGQSFTFGIELKCLTSPNCHANLSISGVISCGSLATGIMPFGTTKTITATCTT